MKPPEREWHRAVDLGGQARRAGKPATTNPHRSGSTERDRVLAEAWQRGHDNGKAGK